MAALKVELVGVSDGLTIALSVFGPLLIASAAVIAALVARRTANERQAEQLLHDTERQREQLDHDTQRQERKLAHDRDLRDREYLFRTVIRGLGHLEEAEQAVIHVSGLVGSLESTRSDLIKARQQEETSRVTGISKILENYREKVGDAMDVAHPCTMQLWADTARLRLLLGAHHDVVACHKELADSMRGWYDAVKEGYYSGNRDEAQLAASKAAASKARAVERRFEAACRVAFGWDGRLP